jgi:hypothetical protein
LLLTISRKAPVPLRAEHPAVFLHEIRVKMQENDKTPEITCTGVSDRLPKIRFAGGGGFPDMDQAVRAHKSILVGLHSRRRDTQA